MTGGTPLILVGLSCPKEFWKFKVTVWTGRCRVLAPAPCTARPGGRPWWQPAVGQGCVFGSSLSARRCPGALPGRVADGMRRCCGRSALRWPSAAAPGWGCVSSVTKTEQVRRAWPLSQDCSGVDHSPVGPIASLTVRGHRRELAWQRNTRTAGLLRANSAGMPGLAFRWDSGRIGSWLKSYRRQPRIFQGDIG